MLVWLSVSTLSPMSLPGPDPPPLSLPVALPLSLPEALTLDTSLVYMRLALRMPRVPALFSARLDRSPLAPSSLLPQSEALERSPLSVSLVSFLRVVWSAGSMTRTFLLEGPSGDLIVPLALAGPSAPLSWFALVGSWRFLLLESEEASFSDVLEAPLSLGLFLDLTSLLPEVLMSDTSSFFVIPPMRYLELVFHGGQRRHGAETGLAGRV